MYIVGGDVMQGSRMLLFILGLVRSCMVFMLLKVILTFVCLNRFVLLQINWL